MSLVLIRRTYNDGDHPNNGIVGAVDTELSSDEVQELWEKWKAEEPDADEAQFAVWIVENHGGKVVDFEVADV